jgi:serine/threonine-protein kinase
MPRRPSGAIAPGREVALGERSVSRAVQRIAGDLDAVILKALRKEPERRYASVHELSEDIADHLAGKPVGARPDGAVYRIGKFVRRRRVEAVAMGLVAVSVIGGLVASTMQARRAERERARATEVTTFLTTMLGAANPGSFGRDVKVREVLDSAAVRAERLEQQPAFDAEIRKIIGDTYLALGEYPLAEQQFRRSLDAMRRMAPGGSREIATGLARLTMVLEFQGLYVAADSVLQEATRLYDRFGYADQASRVDHLDARGRILIRLGHMEPARAFLSQALEAQKAIVPANDSALANEYANLAIVTSELGRNDEAESLMVAAVEAARRAHGEVHPLVAAILSPLATIQERAGHMDRAGATYRTALSLRRELLGEQHPDYAWTMFNYADHLLLAGDNAGAAEWSRRVLALRGTSLEDAHPAVSTAMSVLGRALGRMDSLASGERWLRESLAVRRKAFPAGHYLIASSESILGEHLTLAGKLPQAERLLLDAEKALVAARGESAPIVRDARTRLVKLYERWGRDAEAARWRSALGAAS